jgi:hypothetical protein
MVVVMDTMNDNCLVTDTRRLEESFLQRNFFKVDASSKFFCSFALSLTPTEAVPYHHVFPTGGENGHFVCGSLSLLLGPVFLQIIYRMVEMLSGLSAFYLK